MVELPVPGRSAMFKKYLYVTSFDKKLSCYDEKLTLFFRSSSLRVKDDVYSISEK